MSLLPSLAASLSYTEATPAQRHQALLGVRVVLDAAYPHLSWEARGRAFNQVQPLLRVEADRAVLPPEGLAALLYHLALSGSPPPPGSVASGEPSELAARPRRGRPPGNQPPAKKQSYTLTLDLIEQLANVSYWRRISVNKLVVKALLLLLRQYPEAQQPRPAPDPSS